MTKIDFRIAGKLYKYQMPDRWEELSQEQFITFSRHIEGKVGIDAELVRQLLKLDDVVAVSLSVTDWWWLCSQMAWLADFSKYTVGLMDKVTLPDGTECLGFSDDFSDVTWQEWMIADSQANAERWDIVAAVLYRPQKPDWDRQSDPRVEFSQWDCDARLPQFQQLDKAILSAVALNYKLMRQQLTRRYRRLFTGSDSGSGSSGANLQSLIRNVMGDNFYEEEKYLKLSVPSVLFQLDRMVREERERRRNARTN